jgi:uncharacterized membrane protein HdeD (DUF308 family)
MLVELSIVVAVIMGLSEIVKRVGLNSKFIPIVNLVFGIVGGIVYLYPNDTKLAVFYGIVAGLTASGLYSGTKNTVEGLKGA